MEDNQEKLAKGVKVAEIKKRPTVVDEIYDAMQMGPARIDDPQPAPAPRGLFICSLYDEY